MLNEIFNEDWVAGMRKHVKDSSVDLIVTAPPYLTAYKTNYRKTAHRFDKEILNDRPRGGENSF